jgi:hypothetical protein
MLEFALRSWLAPLRHISPTTPWSLKFPQRNSSDPYKFIHQGSCDGQAAREAAT